MALITKDILIDKLSLMYPELTRNSLSSIILYGDRRLIHLLNNGDDVLINGTTKSNYNGVLFCKDVSFKEHIDEQKKSKLKRLNRKRVLRYLNKEKSNG